MDQVVILAGGHGRRGEGGLPQAKRSHSEANAGSIGRANAGLGRTGL